MKKYELNYLISAETTEEEIKLIEEKISFSIKEGEGILIETNYPVKREAFYFINLSFDLSPEKIADLEEKLKSEPKIIRYMILNKPPVKFSLRERRTRKKPIIKTTTKTEEPKVELKEIEKKLEEILGDELK